jgi:hypothetical protein
MFVVLMFVIVMLVVVMDTNPLFINGKVSQTGIHPAARIVVIDLTLAHVRRLVSVAAEDA